MAKRSPILGYNHNARYRGLVFHVQTEDSGVLSPHLFTHLFYGGTIISTRKLVYDAGSAEDAIKALMQAQHRAVMKDLKNGVFDDKIDQYLVGTEGLEPRNATRPTPVPRASTPEVTPPPAADLTDRATTDVDSATIEAVHARVTREAEDELTTPIELALEPPVGHAPTVQVHAPTVQVHAPTIEVPTTPDTEPMAKPRTKTADRGSRGSSVRFKQPPLPEVDDAPTLSNDAAASVAAAVQAANRGATPGRTSPPPIPSRTATPPPIPQKALRPTLDSSPEISIEVDDDSDRVRSHRDTAVENPFEAIELGDSDGIPRRPGDSSAPVDRARTASQSAATLPPAKKPSRPAISAPAVMSRPITNADDKSGAVEIYAPAPASVDAPPGERSERPGQYSMKRATDGPRREQTGKMAPLTNPNAIPSGLGRPHSPSSSDRPSSGQVRVPQPTPASAVPQAIGKDAPPGSRSPHVTAPISTRTAQPSSGVVMTRPAVIVGAPPKGAAQTPPRIRKAREDEGRGFGQGLISEKSLDEVILAYLSEDGDDK